jgi:polar amino acid transport system permease protein
MESSPAPKRRSRLHELMLRGAVTVGVLGLLALALAAMDYDWRWGTALRWHRALLRALWVTVWISVLSLLLGTALGFVTALGRMSRTLVWNQLASIYVEVIRGTPFLVQLIVLYYGIAPQLGVDNPMVIAVAGLAFFAGAYVGEIIRAGIQSIDRGQTEAARSLGMTRWQCMRHVLIPQTIPRILPPLTGQFINNIKDSSLLSVIAVSEVTKVTRDAASKDALAFELYVPLALLYLAITLPLSLWNRRLEERLRV